MATNLVLIAGALLLAGVVFHPKLLYATGLPIAAAILIFAAPAKV